jgi:GT2 family glycosyltransferase
MIVHCLIPAHNRLADTREVLRCLRVQEFRDLRIVVVDDGSTDGTSDYIRQQFEEVELLSGDGSLWWGGAMAKGLAAILLGAKAGDFVLFLNNDVRFDEHFVERLVTVSLDYGRAVVGSILMDAQEPERILSIGLRIRYGLTRIEEMYQPSHGEGKDRRADTATLSAVIEVDALSGRGTLYPVEVLRKIGSVRHRWLPHYMGDYEISVRAKAASYKTLVATNARVWTSPETSRINPHNASIVDLLFSRRSRSNILDSMAFFSLCGPWYFRLTGPLRVILFRGWRAVRRCIPHFLLER